MKKSLLTTIVMLLAIILPINSLAQNIIQFEDDAVKALCVANWDTDGDGELSYDEAAAVTDLGEVFKGNTEIVRFFELEYFSGLTAIGNNAFYDCENLQEIRLPQTITNIGSAAFFSDENLMFIELPEELKTIGHAAFGICRSLKSLFIPASVTSINGTAFRDCTGLESITVNEQNTIYDSRSQCNAIIETSTNTLITGCRTTVIPEGIVAIGRYAFYGHYEIKTLDFPSTLEIIGENSFNGTGFVTIDIPNSVTTIAFWAFTNCHSLESVRISSSVKEIDRPFINCGNLKFIVVDEGNTVYDSRNNCNGIIETTTNRIIVGCNTTIIPDGVVSIGSQAFASTQIQSLILPESVTSIEEMAFWSSNIASIEIPEKMATIGSNAFAGCNKLESIRSYIKKPFVINENTFLDNTYQNATLFVRTGTKTAYQNTEAWNHFANIEEFGDPVALDPEPYAALSENNTVLTFYFDEYREQRNGMSVGPFENLGSYGVSTEWYDNRSTITTVVFDDSFANCTTLTSTAYWFYQLTKLTTIKGIQNLKTDNVNDINSMFCDCESLTSLDLSNLNLGNVTNMHQVFEGCTGLENIIFDGVNTENVTNMGDLFLNCSSLKTIDLSSFNTNKVTNMRSMFYRCTSLTTVYVSDSWTTASVTESNNMFERCYSIVGGKGTTFDENYIDATYARIDGGPNSQTPGYFTRKGDAPWVDPNVGDAEPYAVLSENNTVLTFYYDDKKTERNGMDVGPFKYDWSEHVYSIPPTWFEQRENIKTVVFDNSFAECTTITSTAHWFYEFRNLTSIEGIENLKTDNVTTVEQMFMLCTSLTSLDVTHFNTGKMTSMFSMFNNMQALPSIDVSNFNTQNVRDFGYMFAACSSLKSLDLSSFDTRKATRIRQMFDGCKSLETVNLSSFVTNNVTDMRQLFLNCSSLKEIDVSHFNTSNVTDMAYMFSNCGAINLDLSSFNIDNVTDIENIFANNKYLASIQAGSVNFPAEEYTKIGNPNLLVYVNEARLAPEGVQNIVVNGVAKEIVLTDNPDGKIVNNNWYCPEPFRAEKISYTREFRQQTQIGISRGWESLALPFAVQTITHQDKGVIAPFGSDASGLHFWLRRLGHEGLISVQMIEPNTPYIISMPNSEDYASRFNLNGRVTFAAEDAYVERTEQMEDESADYMMVPAFQRMPVSEYVYALNVGEERNGRPEGSIFERNYREVRPFEAYTLHRGDQPAPLFFDLSALEGSTTDVPDVRWMMDDGNGEWYDLQGRKLGSTLNVQRSTLKKGVYIRNGRKTVVK